MDGKVKVKAARCTATWLPRGRMDGKVKVKAARCTATWLPRGRLDGQVKVNAARCTATWLPCISGILSSKRGIKQTKIDGN